MKMLIKGKGREGDTPESLRGKGREEGNEESDGEVKGKEGERE